MMNDHGKDTTMARHTVTKARYFTRLKKDALGEVFDIKIIIKVDTYCC